MKKSRFIDGQIIATLKQGKSEVTIVQLCRKQGMSDANCYNWQVKPDKLVLPSRPNQVWLVVFMLDQLKDSKQFRTHSTLDHFILEGAATKVDFALPTSKPVRVLVQVIE
ncbi:MULTISPECIES: hypothetical protein [unclassified Pseudovibrio]|uniref:hypothetical protein n=1 Tax=unclassified Pseudovibrio TaxID=2627060 RepID=UPI0007AE526A|nr:MULTISPECIES: hypothetical protein [unclassified Pseudovibrio]KZL01854.1 hypothetical protein PsW74_01757 [Pseudovibrio sp. W74]KZL02984.1 hypothetical protein PsAD14_05769 [Pseudovibrio sp. Ad14]